MSADPHLQRAETLATLLDDAVELPVVGRIGIDPLLGVIPVIGDSFTAIVGLVIVFEAFRAGVPTWYLVRMLLNVGIGWAIGLIPLVGNVLDVYFRANRRNVRLFERALDG
ncbi:DUF4112 domain-containing protein [Salinirubellus salinus]|uniref:DUF4112 domain-containing protein n=1 Tax=Salinirubellus salinus TaxID=1364945 RepID=A0A9E7R5S9_9EURY|nr:DUF4112 domain-containing protein [Salinirubellus salinus]UWM56339.1 DUF4112 domain-containing protein [Salinirubellus salinus]